MLSHCWDQEEPKLLVCEAKRHPQATNQVTKEQAPLWTRRASSTVMTMPAFNDNSNSNNRLAGIQVMICVLSALCQPQKHNSLILEFQFIMENRIMFSSPDSNCFYLFHPLACLLYVLFTFQGAEIVVVTLLSSPEHDVLIQDVFPLAEHHSGLLGLHIPYYILLRKVRFSRKDCF